MKRMRKYVGAIVWASITLAFPGCSDTWDDHYEGGQGTSATQSLWELISTKENLSNFAEIAQKVHYYRDETHPQADYTFQNMLDGTQLLTVWAPENEALTNEQWQQWKQLAESNPYAVQQQLLANSISLWRQVATGGGIDTLTMLNGKNQAFDKTNFTMASIELKEKNLAATNGTLHTIGTTIPFNYNIYEFLKDETNATSNKLTRFHEMLIANDTTYFNESGSIEGLPDADGFPTYVDSAYFTTNMMFSAKKRFPSNSNTEQYLTYDESFGEHIESEDSTIILIMPTDEAWEKAYQKLEPYYRYASKYKDQQLGDANSTVYKAIENPDSLKEKCINMDILSPLCFDLHFQPNSAGRIGRWKIEDFMENCTQATYFYNTFADTLRSDDNWAKESLFEGKKVKMSNGYGIITDSWNFPAKLYKPDVIIEVGSGTIYNSEKMEGSTRYQTFSNATAQAWIDTVGHVSKDNFYRVISAGANAQTKVEFKLIGNDGENYESEVMSGKYDIYAVLVPNYYVTSKESIVGDTVKHKFIATLSYCNGEPTGKEATKKTSVIDWPGEKVDSVLLFEDFEFPYSYKNMSIFPSVLTRPRFYPTLCLETKTNSGDRKNGYSNTYCIDRIILKSKEE